MSNLYVDTYVPFVTEKVAMGMNIGFMLGVEEFDELMELSEVKVTFIPRLSDIDYRKPKTAEELQQYFEDNYDITPELHNTLEVINVGLLGYSEVKDSSELRNNPVFNPVPKKFEGGKPIYLYRVIGAY